MHAEGPFRADTHHSSIRRRTATRVLHLSRLDSHWSVLSQRRFQRYTTKEDSSKGVTK